MVLAGGTDAMNEFIQRLNLPEFLASLESWFDTHVLVVDKAVQVGMIVLALAAGRSLGPRLRQAIVAAVEHCARRAELRTSLPVSPRSAPQFNSTVPVDCCRSWSAVGTVRPSSDANSGKPDRRLGADPSALRIYPE